MADLRNIWYPVQSAVARYGSVKSLKLYEFNEFLQLANSELLYTYLNMNGNPSSSTEETPEQLDVLNKYKRFMTVNPPSRVLPEGYIRHVKDGAINSAGVKVDIISLEEYVDRKSNSLTAPSLTNPVAYILDGFIYTYPETFGSYTLYYYLEDVLTVRPKIVFNSNNEYDPVYSVQLRWPDYLYPRIIGLILKYMNISVGDPNAMQQILNATTHAS